MGYTSDEDHQDYQKYKTIVIEIEGALETLPEEQYSIIKLKWMQDVTLKQIAERKHCGLTTVKKNHRLAMSRLNDALRFTKLEEIETHVFAKTSAF
jgi:DNA-directed RNA polymerase specialized sigma24 family protein